VAIINIDATLDPSSFLVGTDMTHITIPYDLVYWHAAKTTPAYPTNTKRFTPLPKRVEFEVMVPECASALGVSSGLATILNAAITASGSLGASIPASARLNNTVGTWVSFPRGDPFAGKEYLQVQFYVWFLYNTFYFQD